MRCSSRLVARTAIDAAVGLAMFIVFALFAGGGVSNAAQTAWASPAHAASPVMQSLAGSDGQTAFYLLAAVFTALVAFNLAFFRHLRRVHAAPPAREELRN